MKIKPEWISLNDTFPPEDTILLITDGTNIGLAQYDKVYGNKMYFTGCGFCGFEWEWEFKPTHFAILEIELPERI